MSVNCYTKGRFGKHEQSGAALTNPIQTQIERIPSGVRRMIIAVVAIALLAFLFPLSDDDRFNGSLPTPTLLLTPPIDEATAGGNGANSGDAATNINDSDSRNDTDTNGDEATDAGDNGSSDEATADANDSNGNDGTADTNTGDNGNNGGASAGDDDPTNTARPRQTPTPVLTATPAPTATPRPTSTPCAVDPEWTVYVVRRGDTLDSIARLAESSVQEVLAGNCILNPNRIVPGQAIFVPSLPGLNAALSATPPPTFTPTAAPATFTPVPTASG
jgi:LysM repeat protein